MMKTLLSILFLALVCLTSEAQIITATVTVTNVAGITNGSTIVVNGNTRLFTNNVTSPSTQITNAASIGQGATNIWIAYVLNGAPQINVFQSGTNAIIFQSFNGSPNVITIGGTFGTVTTTTSNPTNGWVVRVPKTVEGANQRTNVSSALVSWIDDGTYVTNIISQGSVALSNYVNTGNSQVIYGAKNFTGGLSGTGGTLTNANFLNPSLTNGYNYGTPFRSPGSGLYSEQFGSNAVASAQGATALGNHATATNTYSLAVGQTANAPGNSATALGAFTAATGASSTALGVNAQASQTDSIAIGDLAISQNSTAVALGAGATTTANNQLRFGTGSEFVSIPGGLQVEGSITNSHFVGTNTLAGDLSFSRANNSSLANGNNAAVNVSTNLYVKVSGPTGSFAINGIAGGRDGRLIILQNSTGQTMTISNDSGSDPTAANRIYTGTGADISLANNPGCCTLIYDASVTHWIIVSTH
jgi:hypothetical protein